MPQFEIDIKRTSYGYVKVQAKDRDEAIKLAKGKGMRPKDWFESTVEVYHEPVDVHEII